jgi:Family of unknown function (DUF6152)
MKMRSVWSVFGCAALAVAVVADRPADAHHSFAMFDNAKEQTLEGTVKEFQWTNPHAWIQLMVPGPDGKQVEWSIECSSPNGLKRQGWRANSIKAGDKVTAIIHPLKNGDAGGSLVIVTLPDGKTLGRRGPPPREEYPKAEGTQ